MTREEMAQAVEAIGPHESLADTEAAEIAAELRKTCGSCAHSIQPSAIAMRCDPPRQPAFDVPWDGSGFCHRWEKEEQQ